MRCKARMILLATVAFGVWAGAAEKVLAQEAPTRVILIIGDGAGAGYWTAAGFAADDLAVAHLPVGGLVDTRNADDKVTDSAASGTAYSTGVRTYNGAIAVGPDGEPVATIV